MAGKVDFISSITPAENLNVSDTGTWSNGASLQTGDLRRKFNFGDQVSELAIAQDPFFRFVSQVAKKPTDDPSFKFTEERKSWHKKYAYVIGSVINGADVVDDSQIKVVGSDTALAAAGDRLKLYMATDYKSSGNIQNVFGQTGSTKVDVGDSGTRPAFFMAGQLVKIPGKNSATDTGTSGYHILKVETVTPSLTKTAGGGAKECVAIEGTVVKFASGAGEFSSFYNDTPSAGGVGTATSDDEQVADRSIHAELEANRSYVIGTAHDEGSGYPETWFDQPYSTGFGLTQIFKTSCAMTNTARATVLKYEPNEWARTWKNKLIEHKYDIEQTLLFGSQATVGNTQYTQGALDFVTTYGNSFTLNPNTKTADDFLGDMSNYLDPRYNNSAATVFFCSTAIYNWLHKLGGYFSNNLNINSNFSADLAVTGRKKVLGLDTTTISTVYGDMNVVRNVHLDGTNVQILGINMKNCAYRPLVGNGVNRDTSVYVGVQTLENSGVDRRVDLILTEAGMEFSLPESHAVWLSA